MTPIIGLQFVKQAQVFVEHMFVVKAQISLLTGVKLQKLSCFTYFTYHIQ